MYWTYIITLQVGKIDNPVNALNKQFGVWQSGMSKRGSGGIATVTRGVCDAYQKLKLVNRTNGCKVMTI